MQEVARVVASPRERFTFRGNLAGTRHGWLRLTPAYSVHLVGELLDRVEASRGPVLDPFCGTGTTLLACAERGLGATTVDLNPFLAWLARAKTAKYESADVSAAKMLVGRMQRAARAHSGDAFVPAIHRVDRWWGTEALGALGRAAAVLRKHKGRSVRATDLAKISLCRALIGAANVSFGHQSMSFRAKVGDGGGDAARVSTALGDALEQLSDSAREPLPRSQRRVLLGDSRDVADVVGEARFGAVVTSPPYSNRMSYIRELRPYMYWLGYLTDRKDAGELDWRAIGGTWGAATSRLSTWRGRADEVPYPGFERIVERIGAKEPILGAYVHRYFEDMARHARGVAKILSPGGRVHYVVGNSKFYDVMLPAEEIFAALFEASGMTDVRIKKLRKRTSKKELFEFLVEATGRGRAR